MTVRHHEQPFTIAQCRSQQHNLSVCPFYIVIVQCADVKREDGTTLQTWQCAGGNPQQVRVLLCRSS